MSAIASGRGYPIPTTSLLTGYDANYDAKKAVMYRRILLEEGDLPAFFTTIYFFVECLAQLGRVPTAFPDAMPA